MTLQGVFIIMPVFVLIGMGCLLQHKERLSPQTLKECNFILYWFAVPATLLRGILSADISAIQNASFLAALWLPFMVTLAVVWVTARRKETHDRFAALVLSAFRGNNFFAGIPIVSLAMGQRGVAAGTLILALCMAVMQLLSISSAQLALLGTVSGKTIRSTCKQLSKNPLFITCLLGLILVSTGLNRLPPFIGATLAILSDISTGLALIMLGAGIRLQNIFKTAASVWRVVLFKLVVHPAVTFAVFTCFGLPRDMIQAGVLLAGMPVAVNTAIVANEMGMNSAYCAMGIAVTTLFSMVTLPLIILLLGLA